MKKVSLFTLLFLCACISFAQTAVTFTFAPGSSCTNGTLTAHVTGLTPPLSITYYNSGAGTSVVHSGVTGTTDTYTYTGEQLFVQATSSGGNAYGNYFNPPFNYTVTTPYTVCPTPPNATITVSGGTAPYTYQWFTKPAHTIIGTGNPFNFPANGQYGVTIVDANGCVSGSDYKQDSLFAYNSPAFSFSTTSTPANCTNGTATIGTLSSGGVAPYSYLWSNGATSPSITGLQTGSYTATVTDAVGCSYSSSTYVGQSVSIQTHTTVTPATCLQNNGSIVSFGSGGTSPYTYLYSNGATTASVSGLAAGSYSVAVTDARGCIGSGSAYVNASTPVTATYSATASSCTSATGSATLSVAGGVTPYSIVWNTYPAQTGATASTLSAGNYGFHITDANGCAQQGIATVPPIHSIALGYSITNPTCINANGSIAVTPSGGTAPYTFLWSNGTTTATNSSIAAGGYGITVTDNSGCSVTKSVNLQASSPVSVGFTSTQESCIFANDGSITAHGIGGVSPYTFHWSSGQTTATISSLHHGNYYVTVTDANGCSSGYSYINLGYNAASNTCYCTIKGHVYVDANNNCAYDAGEAGVQNIQIHCDNGIGYTYTDTGGNYSFIVPTGTYNISQTVLAYYPLKTCQSNLVSVTVTAAAGCSHTVDFADSLVPIHDIHMSTWNYNLPVPGFGYHQKVIIKNDGSVAEPGMIAGYNTDGQLGAASFAPTGLFAGSGNQYSLPAGALTLQPGSVQSLLANYSVPTNIPVSTSLVFKDSAAYVAPMSNWLNDYSPWNNVNYFTTPVVGPYDPNFMQVSPQGAGPTGLISYKDSILEYMIHFQNVGNYKAQNIVVLDTLDANVDWTTMRPEYMSAPCVVTMNNGIARFTFNNINLPAQSATSDIASSGMLTYTVKQKHGLAVGAQIKNKAAIYFDYNEPVITNTTLNTIQAAASVPMVNGKYQDAFQIYPNPASHNFNIVVNSNGGDDHATIAIMDLSGKTLLTKPAMLQKGTQTIAVNDELVPGLYFVTLVTNGTSHTQKLVIIK